MNNYMFMTRIYSAENNTCYYNVGYTTQNKSTTIKRLAKSHLNDIQRENINDNIQMLLFAFIPNANVYKSHFLKNKYFYEHKLFNMRNAKYRKNSLTVEYLKDTYKISKKFYNKTLTFFSEMGTILYKNRYSINDDGIETLNGSMLVNKYESSTDEYLSLNDSDADREIDECNSVPSNDNYENDSFVTDVSDIDNDDEYTLYESDKEYDNRKRNRSFTTTSNNKKTKLLHA